MLNPPTMTLGLEPEGGKHYLRAPMWVTRPGKFTWQPLTWEDIYTSCYPRSCKQATERSRVEGKVERAKVQLQQVTRHWPWTQHAGGWFAWDSCVPRKYAEGKTRDWSCVVDFSETLYSLASRSRRPSPENTLKKLKQNKKQGLNQTQCLWSSPVSPFTSQ